jgi:hypothetical protein
MKSFSKHGDMEGLMEYSFGLDMVGKMRLVPPEEEEVYLGYSKEMARRCAWAYERGGQYGMMFGSMAKTFSVSLGL